MRQRVRACQNRLDVEDAIDRRGGLADRRYFRERRSEHVVLERHTQVRPLTLTRISRGRSRRR